MVDGDETLIWSLQTASNEGEHLMVDVPRKQGQRCQFFWHEREWELLYRHILNDKIVKTHCPFHNIQ